MMQSRWRSAAVTQWALTHGGALIACFLFLLAGLAVLDHYGAAGDEAYQRNLVINTAGYVLHGDKTLLQTHDRFYGAAFELPLFLLTERILGLEDPRDIHLGRHLLSHLFFIVGGFFCYLLAARLFDNRLLALFVMLLFLLSPRLYAHSFVNTKDLPFLSMFAIVLFFVHRAFRKESVRAFLLCGVLAGLLINLRVMGATLVIAVLAFRGWDFFLASRGEEEREERKRILATGGVFALASLVALCVSLPYLWGNPVLRLVEMFVVLANHPNIVYELFGGLVFASTELPWDYALRWFAMTTPPPTLLLGLLGMGVVCHGLVARRALARPVAFWRDAPLRFGCLLAACFVLPLAAIMLLRPALYDGWRQVYFLHVPFCLLAGFALAWLSKLQIQGLRKGAVNGLAYALTAAGLCVVVFQMARIHPHQQVYFNFLADREIPEGLRGQYETDYWNLSLRQGYEYILRHYPAAAINMRPRGFPLFDKGGNEINQNVEMLPARARSRFTYDPNQDPDFYLGGNALQPPPGVPRNDFLPVIHRIKVYDNTIMTLSTPDLSRIDPAVADEYRALQRAATAGEPAARAGGYGVYRRGNQLAWVKEQCQPGDLMPPFWLAFYPADASHLPRHRREEGYVNAGARGVRVDGKCLAARRLPDYPLARVRLGQRSRDGEALWEARVDFNEQGGPLGADPLGFTLGRGANSLGEDELGP